MQIQSALLIGVSHKVDPADNVVDLVDYHKQTGWTVPIVQHQIQQGIGRNTVVPLGCTCVLTLKHNYDS